jgi:hypothetical protein
MAKEDIYINNNTNKLYTVLCFFLGGQIILFCNEAIALYASANR